jgi:hypothetical protein
MLGNVWDQTRLTALRLVVDDAIRDRQADGHDCPVAKEKTKANSFSQ